jgi:hypothetical protein
MTARCVECGAEFEARRKTARYCPVHNTAAARKARQRAAREASWGPTVMRDRFRPGVDVADLLRAQGIEEGGPSVEAWNADHGRRSWSSDGDDDWKLPKFKPAEPIPYSPNASPGGREADPLDAVPWRADRDRGNVDGYGPGGPPLRSLPLDELQRRLDAAARRDAEWVRRQTPRRRRRGQS